ncbi:MAG: ACP S-malonyltransferase [bacterium]|nr:ACP S-malonyltransferase [bacterium]
MGRELASDFPRARATLAEADAALGFALSRLCFAGPAEELALTAHAQPAILAVSVAAWRVLADETGVRPLALAGHSLGEWSALVVAGAIAFGDAVRGVRERGRLMQAAVPVGEGAMAAVLGLDPGEVETLCREAAGDGVCTPANLNGGGQVVVAGHAAAVERLIALAGARRARATRLAVSAPFHCALMAPAAEGLAAWLADVPLAAPALPVVTSVEARPVGGADDVRALLVRQVTAPVRWEDTARAVGAMGAAVALEVGPGRVLAGLMRRIVPGLPTQPTGDPAGVARAREVLA